MAIAAYALPFGLRDVKIRSLGADSSTPGAAVDLPVARTLSFADAEEFEELRGDDALVAEHGSGPSIEWELESGGIALEAYAIMSGGSVVSSGTTPNVKKTYTKLTTTERPYFKAEGQAISDSGGDFHTVLYKLKATDNLEGELSEGSFWLTGAGGRGYGSTEPANIGKIYDLVHNETAAAIV